MSDITTLRVTATDRKAADDIIIFHMESSGWKNHIYLDARNGIAERIAEAMQLERDAAERMARSYSSFIGMFHRSAKHTGIASQCTIYACRTAFEVLTAYREATKEQS